MINCEGNKTDMFLPLKFEVRQKPKTFSTDLFKNAFGEIPNELNDLTTSPLNQQPINAASVR
jgi:hypothetical protein